MIRPTLRSLFASAAALACAAGGVALAADSDASPWAESAQSAIRLLDGGVRAEGRLLAGVEIRLSPKAKTYWRSPGDSGVPPSFDWSGSTNLGAVSVKWPVPVRFEDGAGTSLGYDANVIFPLLVTPADPQKPVTLALALDYAVCEKMCIPARGAARLALSGQPTPQTRRVEAFEAKAPKTAPFGPAPDRIALVEAKAAGSAGKPVLRLVLTVPEGQRLDEVFVEGPYMWLFGMSRLSRGEGDSWIVETPLEDRPKRATGAQPLIATIIGGPVPLEIRFDLDFAPAAP